MIDAGRMQSSIFFGRYFSTQRNSSIVYRVRLKGDPVLDTRSLVGEVTDHLLGDGNIIIASDHLEVLHLEEELEVVISMRESTKFD